LNNKFSSYIESWFNDKNVLETRKQNFKILLKRKQIEFVLGGRVMADEAATTYSSVITALELGHQWIRDFFGSEYLPK